MEKGFLGYLLKLLQIVSYRVPSDDIQIAKGKYHLPSSWKEVKEKLRKEWPRKHNLK